MKGEGKPQQLPAVQFTGRSSNDQAQQVANQMHRPDPYSRIEVSRRGHGGPRALTGPMGHPTKGFGKSKRKKAQRKKNG